MTTPKRLDEILLKAKTEGWVCPNCGNVYGPFVPECTACNGPGRIT